VAGTFLPTGKYSLFLKVFLATGLGIGVAIAIAQEKPDTESWKFATSGDSRNCGDVVMPAIAADALRHDVAFYWHLGDFRLMKGGTDGDIDGDITARYGADFTVNDYHRDAWGDFIDHQIAAFGLTPVYLARGNHELAGGKTDADYVNQFAYWLDKPEIRLQRSADHPPSDSLIYYHWRRRNVDFITLDNAPDAGFGGAQIRWFEGVLERDKRDSGIRTLVVGMHRALPNSLACGHSMNGDHNNYTSTATIQCLEGGRRVYQDLQRWRDETGRHVYVLASHSHFYMEHIFETLYWKNRTRQTGKVLPGWIVGTAGAERYQLPDRVPKWIRADTYVSGYLLATVKPTGEIDFEFREVTPDDVPSEVRQEFKDDFIDGCFSGNRSPRPPAAEPPSCSED
jgi:hypothetical protein